MTHPEPTVAEREYLAQQLASTTAPYLAFAVGQRDEEMVRGLLDGMSRQELLALAVVLADSMPQPRTRPDDGVVDEVAIRRAVDGEPIPLTRAERLEAVRVMAGRGETQTQICRRLHMAGTTVKRLLDELGIAPAEVLADEPVADETALVDLRDFYEQRRSA